jgi:glycosyltransferase involved in cell wall biosynthesis
LRILYITTGFPYPLTSGLLRHYFFIKELSRRHSVTLLSLVQPGFRPEYLEHLQPFTDDILTFARQYPKVSFSRRVLRQLVPGSGHDPSVHRLGESAARLLREQTFDAVLFSGKQTHPALRHLSGTPFVADLCDSVWIRFRSSLPYVHPRRLPISFVYFAYHYLVERKLARDATHVLFAAPRDRDALGAQVQGRATVIPNGVDLEYWRRSSRERGVDTIVFTGAMHYRPNADAALHLIREIMPLVWRAVPEARVMIVGRDPTPALEAAGRQRWVTVTGAVEDMRPYLEQATVFAAPLRVAAGIQNKLLEAMAMEVPIVASPIAADGVRSEGGEPPPIAIARDPQEFARELLRRLEERRTEPAPDPHVRRYVQRHFDWQASAEKLERVLQLVTQGLPAPLAGRVAAPDAETPLLRRVGNERRS